VMFYNLIDNKLMCPRTQALEIDWDKGTPSWWPRRVSPWEVRRRLAAPNRLPTRTI